MVSFPRWPRVLQRVPACLSAIRLSLFCLVARRVSVDLGSEKRGEKARVDGS